MRILDYITAGGKNVILEYIDDLDDRGKLEARRIRSKIREDGILAFDSFNTRHLRGKLWEIKFSSNRIMYVIADAESVYFLHACKKQKGRAEKFELEKALQRAKEANLM
ncbi:MAG: type II toxin-antitoxin system RelE/ParE family toxin [Defluviitaleaceae bacterium]|nr:type II toxin-antitoxin system RelE/ParE family toxin [Defluviitaleaceae bacterium]